MFTETRIAHLLAMKPERFLVNCFAIMAAGNRRFDELPHFDAAVDRVDLETILPTGRADITLWHHDGSVTVIEVKDGAKGSTYVAQGIGQVCMYAAQLQMKGRVATVRRALMWSSCGENGDLAIEGACLVARVIAIPMLPVVQLMAEFAENQPAP